MQHSRSTNGTHYSVQTVLWMKSLSMEKKSNSVSLLYVHLQLCQQPDIGFDY